MGGHHHHHGPRPDAESLARADGAFHDNLAADYAERVQWDTPRNQLAHGLIHDAVLSFGEGGRWAEVGAGLSLDGEALARRGIRLMAVEPSRNMLMEAQARLVGEGLTWDGVQAQGAALPFADGALDGVLWVASLHHLPSPPDALKESARAVRSGGGVVVGMEPAAWWHAPVEHTMDKLRPKLAKGGRFSEEGSPADAMGEGFSRKDWQRMGEHAGLRLRELKPLWLTLGVMHLGLEGVYRVLKLRKRVHLPGPMERGLWHFDNAMSRVPMVRNGFWHWLAVYEKP